MRGLVIGGMVLGLLMGCNNGLADELAAQKRLGEIGRSAENAFYEFMGLIADTLGLGFRVTEDKKKNEVAGYFNTLGDKVGEASKELDKVAEKAAGDGDKDGLLSKTIKEAVDTAKNTLKELKKHLEGLKGIGDGQNVGWAATSDAQGASANQGELENVFKALKGIMGIATTSGGVKELSPGAITLTANNKVGAKILSTSGGATATAPAKAAAILTSVSGEEMLASIIGSEAGDAGAELGGSAEAGTSALKFAKGGSAANLAGGSADQAKAAALAGGIALRSLVKEGKLAAGGTSKAEGGPEEVQGVGRDAVNKLLVAVEGVIKKTVKTVIGTVKQKIDEARDSKATVQK